MTISTEYREILKEIHAKEEWGYASQNELPRILEIIKKYQIKNVLDYGAGKQFLAKNLPINFPNLTVESFEPGIDNLNVIPKPAELVCCIDVLEHIEPEFIDQVLDELKRVTQRIGYFTVATKPAKRILPNGKNAHLIVQPIEWWYDRIAENFLIAHHHYQSFLVTPK